MLASFCQALPAPLQLNQSCVRMMICRRNSLSDLEVTFMRGLKLVGNHHSTVETKNKPKVGGHTRALVKI